MDILGGIIANIADAAINTTHNLVFDWANFARQSKVDKQNFSLQQQNYNLAKETLNWNKMQTEWEKQQYLKSLEREDTAVQRRLQDVLAAGFHPSMALGDAATTAGPISPNHVNPPDQAPQRQIPTLPEAKAVQIWQLYKDIMMTDEQIKGLKSQRRHQDAESRYAESQADWEEFKNSEPEMRWRAEYGRDLQAMEEWIHDKEYLLKEGSPTWLNKLEGTTSFAKQVRDLGVDPDTMFGRMLQILLYSIQNAPRFK